MVLILLCTPATVLLVEALMSQLPARNTYQSYVRLSIRSVDVTVNHLAGLPALMLITIMSAVNAPACLTPLHPAKHNTNK